MFHPDLSHSPSGQPRPDLAADVIDLRLLATTDLHMNIRPHDYYRDRPAGNCGLARLSGVIATARSEATNSLLLDNGDFLQGSPMGDMAARPDLFPPGLHPMIAAMNRVGYDAATLGNHDFNYGLPFLAGALAGAEFPVVLTNLLPAGDQPALAAPVAILHRRLRDRGGRRRGVKIGVIGLTPPQVMDWDRDHLAGRMTVRDMTEAARAAVPALRAAGADLVIALCHGGIGAPDWRAGSEDPAIPLARLSGVDALILGHSHLLFPSAHFADHADVDCAAGTIAGVPAVMSGAQGAWLGQIDLVLARQGGRMQILSSRTALRPVEPTSPPSRAERAVSASVRECHAATLAYIRRPVGHSATPITSHFALVGAEAGLALVAEAQAAHVRRALAATPHAGVPVLSAVSPFKTGGRGGPGQYCDIPAGPLRLCHVADLYPYPNALRAVRVTGAQVADWLERSAALFHRIAPGALDAPLLVPEAPGYNFDVIHGLDYRIDLSQPARHDAEGRLVHPRARRICDLRFQGRPVTAGMTFVLATNNYRLSAGNGFPAVAPDQVLCRDPVPVVDLLARHIQQRGTVTGGDRPVWRFVAQPGTTVTFATAPAAAATLARGGGPPGLRIEPLGLTEVGFLTCRLFL